MTLALAAAAHLLLAVLAGARAGVELDYEAPPDARCLTRSEFSDELGALLGHRPVERGASRVARVRYLREGARLRGELSLFERGAGSAVRERGHRALTGAAEECAGLGKSLAMALAVALDPQASRRLAPTTPSAPAAGGAEAHLGPMLHLAQTPGLAAGLSAGLLLGASPRAGRIQLGAEASYALATTRPEVVGLVRSSLARVTLLGCARLLVLRGCAAAHAGLLQVEGQSFAENRRARTVLVGLGPRLEVSVPVGRLAVGALAEAPLSLVRPRVVLDERELWRMPAWSLTAAARVGLTFD